jgi:putative DNA primase/helicase
VLEQLIDKGNVVSPTINSLAGEFGRMQLIDKTLAVIADARLQRGRNVSALVETLLSISGGDAQTINRKNQAFWTGYLATRFLIMTNVLPVLPDASRTIATRFILLILTESFLGREDPDLKKKLAPELPGILNWALEGLDRLRKRGYFRQPKSSQETLRLMEDLAAPVGAYVRDWCQIDPALSCSTKQLYRAYKVWAEDAGQRALADSTFGKELRDVVSRLSTSGKGATRRYIGVDLTPEGLAAWDQLRREKGLPSDKE